MVAQRELFAELEAVMFTINLTEHALEDLQVFRKSERILILDTIEGQLQQDPLSESSTASNRAPTICPNGN